MASFTHKRIYIYTIYVTRYPGDGRRTEVGRTERLGRVRYGGRVWLGYVLRAPRAVSSFEAADGGLSEIPSQIHLVVNNVSPVHKRANVLFPTTSCKTRVPFITIPSNKSSMPPETTFFDFIKFFHV